MLHDTTDTIAALCTPPGASARAIVRLSGEQAIAIASLIFQPEVPSAVSKRRCLQTGALMIDLPGCGAQPCPAQVLFMPAPASYTRQDVVELILPGSPPLLDALLAQLAHLGARQAQPGEFTLRAFLNGRIDLAQAEAVEGLVRAQNEAERRAALEQLSSGRHTRLEHWKATLTEVAGMLEASLDFEEEELEPDLEASLQGKLFTLAEECAALAAEPLRDDVRDGSIRILLAGLTNAGKSSLLNALLGREAAIVSPERSTTRDRTVHELTIGRYRFSLEDCPGIDTLPDTTVFSPQKEQDGSPRAEEPPHNQPLARAASAEAARHYAAAPLLLLVCDAQAGVNGELRALFAALPPCRAVLALNKSDAPAGASDSKILTKSAPAIRALALATPQLSIAADCRCSARTGSGVDELRQLLCDLAAADAATDARAEHNRRQAAEISEAARACAAAAELLPVAQELAAAELRTAFEAVHRASGTGYAEDILSGIFSRFCIGK